MTNLCITPDLPKNPTLRFGRFATDAEKTRIQKLAEETMPARQVDPRFILVHKELRLPFVGWRIPILTKLVRFISEMIDGIRAGIKASGTGLEKITLTQLVTNLKDPEGYFKGKKKDFEKVLKRNPDWLYSMARVKDTNEVLIVREITGIKPHPADEPPKPE
jgi:hypothetical protein